MNANSYIAVILPSDDLADSFEALFAAGEKAGLVPVLRRERLCVLARRNGAVRVICGPGGMPAGVTIGETFDCSSACAGTTTPGAQPPPDARRGAALWGAYVAIEMKCETRSVDITRDPSGMAPCLFARQGGAVWVFSDMATALSAGFKAPGVDWTGLAHYLAAPHFRGRRSCLAGVDMLTPGMRLRIAQDHPPFVECAWTPWDHAAAGKGTCDYEGAVHVLRDVAASCIGAWSARAGRVLLELSGGLDSAIIAACLRERGADFSCVTFASGDPAGDEREHARRVASHLGVALTEMRLDAGGAGFAPDPARAGAYPGATPWGRVVDGAVSAAASEAGADAIFSGGGGDNVFCYLTTAAPAADALRVFGPGRRYLETVGDLSKLHGASFWRAARYSIRKAVLNNRKLFARSEAFLSAEAAALCADPHPWFETIPRAIPPGRAEHAASLASAVSVSDGAERAFSSPLFYPLLSAPLMELCLGTPSWMWVKGGRNRAAVRDAFADALPCETLSRRTKGDLTGFIAETYRNKRAEIAGLLLEGRMADNGVIGREAVEARLKSEAPFRDAGFTRLVWLAAAEAWIQSWDG